MQLRSLGVSAEMDIRVIDRSLMMVFLLEECNLSCAHCVREEEPMPAGYRLEREQLTGCLADCASLESIRWVHFSGGEPTLWREGDLDLADLLVEISRAGLEPGFTTNGKAFEDYGICCDLFNRVLPYLERPVHLYLSIDTFHANFDVLTGRSLCLDNVLECRRAMPSKERGLLNINVAVVVSKDDSSLLPDGMVEHYRSLGVKVKVNPLKPKGLARSLAHLCPDLQSDRPEDLGAYYRYRTERLPEGEDRAAANIVLIGEDYYFPDPWRKVARLGHLPPELALAYSIDG